MINSNSFIKNFTQLSKKDTGQAGGKGASLGEMTRAGLAVPPGFVLLAETFDYFLHETKLDTYIASILKSKINIKNFDEVTEISKKIRKAVAQVEVPSTISKKVYEHFKKLKAPFVAVRSSATAEDSQTASWAGELETSLNVTRQNLLRSIVQCWSSLFTSRAIVYRFEKGLQRKKISVAVVVQKMLQSESSGIAFTVHPVTQDKNSMIIEAGFGLGEAIVSGQVTPDTYIIAKKDMEIVDIKISQQQKAIYKGAGGNRVKNLPTQVGGRQKLTGPQILQLAKLCAHIEKHYGYPQDIEWALEKGRLYVVQSRPITTLKK